MNIITDWFYRHKETKKVFSLNRIEARSNGVYVVLLSNKKDDRGNRTDSIEERVDRFIESYEMLGFEEILDLLNKN